jgi:hypothetical protein
MIDYSIWRPNWLRLKHCPHARRHARSDRADRARLRLRQGRRGRIKAIEIWPPTRSDIMGAEPR